MSDAKWPEDVLATVRRMKEVGRTLSDLFTDRDDVIEMLILAAVCHEHVLLIGPPGTAKTELVSRFTDLIDATGFHYLMSRYTEPSELFGPIDLEQFRRGKFEMHTKGMLPDSQIVFLDELFQGASPILNTLLSILNERLFHNGSERRRVPLISLIGASNAVPEDPWLKAFGDRFVMRLEVNPLGDEKLDELLTLGWSLERERVERMASQRPDDKLARIVKISDLKSLHGRLAEIEIDQVRSGYAELIRELRSEGVQVSDRRAVRGLRLVAGACLLRGARTATPQDFGPLRHLWTRSEEVERVRNLVNQHMSGNSPTTVEPDRSVDDIRRYLETIKSKADGQHSEAARVARMASLNDLKREVLREHPRAVDLRKQIDDAIEFEIRAMETTHV